MATMEEFFGPAEEEGTFVTENDPANLAPLHPDDPAGLPVDEAEASTEGGPFDDTSDEQEMTEEEREFQEHVQELIKEYRRLSRANEAYRERAVATVQADIHPNEIRLRRLEALIDFILPDNSVERMMFEIHWQHHYTKVIGAFLEQVKKEKSAANLTVARGGLSPQALQNLLKGH